MDETGPQIFMVEREPPRQHSVQATKLIHEHYGDIMAFVCSRAPLTTVRKKFLGEWKYLDRALFELPEERATRALIELALYVRMVDDDEGRVISKLRDGISFGEVVRLDESRKPLSYREVSNKIIHALRYEWRLAANADPTVLCIPSPVESASHKWKSASINLIGLGFICGGFMS